VTALPFVSVVVPAWDGDVEIGTCLASLAQMDYPPDRHEVIVVDTTAAGGIAAAPPARPARRLRAPPGGASHARNAGIGASRGGIVAFTDTDCAVSRDWLRELVDPFVDPLVGAVGGAILPYPPRTPAQRYAARRLSHSQLRPIAHPRRPFAMTPNVAFRRDPLVRIGMFDTRFPGGGWEDADVCWRLAAQTGLRLAYAPAAVVLHRYRATARDFLVQHYRYGYGLGILCRKYRAELGLADATRLLGGTGGARHGWESYRFDILRSLAQRAGLLRAALLGGHDVQRAEESRAGESLGEGSTRGLPTRTTALECPLDTTGGSGHGPRCGDGVGGAQAWRV
jgi:GT2 family glycosyltransferase